jgi:uncharacterized protein (DUF2141 family)
VLKTLCLLFLFIISQQSAETYDLTIIIDGFSSNKGSAYIAIYRKTDEFPVFGKQFKGRVVEIANQTARITLNNLPQDNYAIAVYHDKNNNKILDKNYLGIPVEAYGFSNNARRTFSAPSFSEAALSLMKNKTIAISVK